MECSEWVYALSVITALIQNGTNKKELLLAEDTILKLCLSEDKSTYSLFGDAGTATALEYDDKRCGTKSCMNMGGSDYEAILIPEGGYYCMF